MRTALNFARSVFTFGVIYPHILRDKFRNSNGTPLPMMRLVVLDDDAATIEFVAAVARRRGWHVDAVTQPSLFRSLIKVTPPDAILLDLQLGTSDGIEQLRFLHTCNYGGSIVLMSGFDARVLASAQEIGNSLGLLVAAVIEKPTRISRIEQVLASIEQSPAKPPVAAMPEPARPRTISPHDIDDAVASGQMALHLQPIVSAGGAVERAELSSGGRTPCGAPYCQTRLLQLPKPTVPSWIGSPCGWQRRLRDTTAGWQRLANLCRSASTYPAATCVTQISPTTWPRCVSACPCPGAVSASRSRKASRCTIWMQPHPCWRGCDLRALPWRWTTLAPAIPRSLRSAACRSRRSRSTSRLSTKC